MDDPVSSDEDRRDEQGGELIRPETVRALDREHHELIVSLRALATLLREPDSISAEEEEAILARILEAELNQVSVLDGEIITALRLEKGEAGPVRTLDLTRALEAAVHRSGRLTLVERSEPVPIAGHGAVIEQEIASALALAHRIADGPVRARAIHHPQGGTAVQISAGVSDATLSAARHDQRVELLNRMVRATGGRFRMERDRDLVCIELRFPDISAATAPAGSRARSSTRGALGSS